MRALFALAFAALLCAGDASAEVRLGHGVRIGGHRMAPQTFSAKRRGLFYLYDRRPPNAGCRWSRTATGRVKTCHWRRLRR